MNPILESEAASDSATDAVPERQEAGQAIRTARGLVLGDRILQSGDSHADWCAAYGTWGQYTVLGGSAIGKMHLRDRRPRDDAFAIRASGPWLAVTVSDGVGSKPLSRYGASFVAEALCEQLLRSVTGNPPVVPLDAAPSRPANATAEEASPPTLPFWKEQSSISHPERNGAPVSTPDSGYGTLSWHSPALNRHLASGASGVEPEELPEEEAIRRAFRNTHQALAQYAPVRGLALRDVSCTLLGLLLHTGTGAFVTGHVGDGLVAATVGDGRCLPLVDAPAPDDGAVYAFTHPDWETYFVLRRRTADVSSDVSSAQEGMEASPVSPSAFFLMTDGVSEDCTHTPPANLLDRWGADVEREMRGGDADSPSDRAVKLVRWLATYDAPGSFDDRTLVVVLRNGDSELDRTVGGSD